MSTVSENVADDPIVTQYDDFIDERLERTSLHLKTLDLVTGLIWVGLLLFGSLFTLVIIDHWIFGLGVWARTLSLVAILAGTLYVGYKRVLTPLLRSINPEYAALTVEHAHPELKNGLISFLFFRDKPGQLRQGVYQGIQQQAATDLTAVPIDSAVDRSAIIKLGYCLVALAALWVGYIVLSPKSPIQTLQRIALPFRDIARPSQVDILEVTPGNVDVYRGQTVEIKTRIEGLKTEQTPSIVFATLDGQLIDQRITLTPDGAGGRFAGTLTTRDGIQQDLEYRVRAGDALSQRYEVHVTEAPHIEVDRLEFDYPSYTGQADEVVQGEGDIRAIEGTRIKVIGKANQVIQRGHIEFVSSSESGSAAPIRAPLKIASEATNAEVRFPLRLDVDRKASLYRAYHLHFTNESGQTSVDPIEHAIEVIPDLRPVVQILTPDKRTIELPENSWQKIEVRAVDPDFKLTRVQLAARTRGRNLFKENMLSTTRSSEWHTGQFIATYRFVPKELGLKEGDVVEYLAVAEDNRHAIGQSKLDPNRTITAKQYIRIVKADPMAEDPPSNDSPQNQDPQQPQKISHKKKRAAKTRNRTSNRKATANPSRNKAAVRKENKAKLARMADRNRASHKANSQACNKRVTAKANRKTAPRVDLPVIRMIQNPNNRLAKLAEINPAKTSPTTLPTTLTIRMPATEVKATEILETTRLRILENQATQRESRRTALKVKKIVAAELARTNRFHRPANVMAKSLNAFASTWRKTEN